MSIARNKTDDGTLLLDLQKELITIKENINGITFNNRSLNKINKLTRENEHLLLDCIYKNEVNINNLNQYSRRSNIEIKNISED